MQRFQASVWREGEHFVAQCLEIDIASQGTDADEALANLREAIELFFEVASPEEVSQRVREGVRVAALEAATG